MLERAGRRKVVPLRSENLMTDHLTSNADDGQYAHSATLNQVDAIMAVEVFQDAYNKFVLLHELAPKIEQHKDEITVYVGKEIERIIDR